MKIKEFLITRYGPLTNTGRISLHKFNLFWGKNEDGKTLTIDAIVKLLLGRNIRDFERIDRVEENPEGYVIIEDDEGREIKLPEKGDLTEVADLTQSECRNIFVIRNSDLSIARESEFYTNVTDRLTGLRTEEISKIKEILREIGKITPSGILRDIKDEKLKTRIENAKALIQKFERLAREIKEKRFDELEEELVRHREEIDRIKQKIENLEDARKREKHEKGREALDRLKEALEKSKDFGIYNEGDEQLWGDYERDIGNWIKDIETLQSEVNAKKKEFDQKEKKLNEERLERERLNERKKRIDNEIKPEIKNYEMGLGRVKRDETRSGPFTVAAIISAVLLSISIIGVIVNPSPLLYGLLASFLISTGIFAALRLSFTREEAHLAAVFARIRLAASRFELDAESVEEILSNIQKFDEEYSKKGEELEELRTGKKILESAIEKLKEGILSIEEKIRDAKDKIDGLKRKSGEESLQEYTKKLKLKQKHEKSLGEQRSILESLLGAKGKTLEENISSWNGEIKDLEEFKDKSKDIEYDEKKVSKLKEEEISYKENLKKLEEKMGRFQKDLEEIEREANKILRLEADYLHCKTSVDLDAVRGKVQEFINENESNKDTVLKVMEFFEEIETKEKGKVSELFEKDSSTSKYFNAITGGLYEEVLFNQEIGEIEVRRKDGVILEAKKLSGGAYDQLYLSIRLALGEKLLKGNKGFFIMDDPFIKADPDRLPRQIETIRKVSKLGWQVIYFSAKGEINDALKEDVEQGDINYVRIQSIFP